MKGLLLGAVMVPEMKPQISKQGGVWPIELRLSDCLLVSRAFGAKAESS